MRFTKLSSNNFVKLPLFITNSPPLPTSPSYRQNPGRDTDRQTALKTEKYFWCHPYDWRKLIQLESVYCPYLLVLQNGGGHLLLLAEIDSLLKMHFIDFLHVKF